MPTAEVFWYPAFAGYLAGYDHTVFVRILDTGGQVALSGVNCNIHAPTEFAQSLIMLME